MQFHRHAMRNLTALLVILVLTLPPTLACRDSSDGDAAAVPTRPEERTPADAAAPAPSQATASSGGSSTPSPIVRARAERTASLTPLGQVTPGNQGFHGDVWGHEGFAYLGTWGTGPPVRPPA